MPSDILGIDEDYTAFCFNEACMYIANQIKNGEKAKWNDDIEEVLTKEDLRNKASTLADMLRGRG